MKLRPAQQAKLFGFKSLNEVSFICGRSVQTLNRWFQNDPDFFDIVLIGCLVKRTSLILKHEYKFE